MYFYISLQVSFPPYLFECLLYAPVDDQASTAQIGNGAVVFKLKKQEPGMWLQLTKDEAGKKQEPGMWLQLTKDEAGKN